MSDNEKKSINWKELALQAVIDLVVGIVLIVIGKYIGWF